MYEDIHSTVLSAVFEKQNFFSNCPLVHVQPLHHHLMLVLKTYSPSSLFTTLTNARKYFSTIGGWAGFPFLAFSKSAANKAPNKLRATSRSALLTVLLLIAFLDLVIRCFS